MRVLIVEDDREIRTLIQASLLVEGFEVQTAVSVSEAAALLQHSPPEVVLLDLGLPDGDGLELVQKVRRQDALPILVISARHQDEEKIRLLDAGADDYLTKPFSVGELFARMRVALRHRGTALRPAVTVHENGSLFIDLERRWVTVNGTPVRLTPTEYKLLAHLARNAGKVVTHRQLLVDAWGEKHAEHTHYLRLYMGQLRAKIEADPAEPRHILTEIGVGYRLAAA